MPLQVIGLIFAVFSFVLQSTQADVQFFQSMIMNVGNVIVWIALRYTPAKSHASVVIVFLFNLEQAVITNLALRNMLPSFVHVDMENLHYFDSQTQIGFIFVNCCLFHDIKWMVFLNGPIYLVGSYL